MQDMKILYVCSYAVCSFKNRQFVQLVLPLQLSADEDNQIVNHLAHKYDSNIIL